MPAGNKGLYILFGIVLLIVAVLGGSYFYLLNSKNQGEIPDSLRNVFNLPQASPRATVATPSPTPRPIKKLPSGRQEYNISHGPEVKGPKPYKAIIDPLTPAKDQKQTTTLMVTSDAEITEAKIILHTDNNKKEYPLKLVDGNTQNGTWEANWTMDDNYDYNYYIQFYLKGSNGIFQEGLRFRQ